MSRSQKYTTRVFFVLLTGAIIFLKPSIILAGSDMHKSSTDHFSLLKQTLVSDGFDKKLVKRIYGSNDVFFDAEGTGLFFVHNEGLLNYESFANKTSIHRARKYIQKHQDYFKKIEKNFGVDKTVITAIILVETGLGTYMGKRKVINTLSTMAALSDSSVREYLWNTLDQDKRLPRERFDKKADKKSVWAYSELKAFIRYAEQEKLDPTLINGSYAGAMGIAQFMPSNILSLARDGNSDGAIDMFDHKDAIASIANYLRHYGWHSDIDGEKAEEVLYAYNHSDYYVAILMKISRLLKGKNG